MYRINHLPTGMRLRDLTNGSTDFLKTLSEIFPPVSGNQHVASRLNQVSRVGNVLLQDRKHALQKGPALLQFGSGNFQCVNHRISGYMNALFCYLLTTDRKSVV